MSVWSVVAPIAFMLRLTHPSDQFVEMVLYTAAGLPLKLVLERFFRLNRQSWRSVTVADLQALATAVAIATVVLEAVALVKYSIGGFPRTIPLIEGVLAFVAMGGARLAQRLLAERSSGPKGAEDGPSNILLVGAGEAGTRVAREMRRHPRLGLHPVGFLDDDPSKAHLRVGGLPVLGQIEDLPRVVEEGHVDEILIAIPSASGRRTRRIVELASVAGVRCRILPGVLAILSGDVSLSSIREVQVQDLLQRERIELDIASMSGYLSDRVVLVTGAGGSIGSEIVRQIAPFAPRKVLLLGHGENSLHAMAQGLKRESPELEFTTIVGSVCDPEKMEEIFTFHRPEVVFHAAAHKHVPMMEFDPDEAVLNNVGGTRTLARAALAAGVQRFVNISSDKAVNPVSMIGITKQIAEQVVRRISQEAGPDQAFVSVRFGNVLGSRGSVVPVFQEQVRVGGPITITDPEMKRYFMTIPEASQLVIQAGSLGENGAVYVLDMGTQVRIVDLARDLIRLSGSEEDDIDFVFTGLRPGEKLEEELFTAEEQVVATRYDEIMVARTEPPIAADFWRDIEELLACAQQREWAGMDRLLGSLLPDLGDRTSLSSQTRRVLAS
jgi:FlaA1/EpsC-like NDP-sugar epimerase